jgi:hypothetical protein
MSYLHYLCLLANSGVQHTLCFVLFFSSCVPYIASFSGLFNCYCPIAPMWYSGYSYLCGIVVTVTSVV